MRTPRQGLGDAGERLAQQVLGRHGYRIQEVNRSFDGLGELDIVAQDGDCLVFVEVRTRRGDSYGTPEDSLTPRKRSRLVSLANAWLEANGAESKPWRIDLVAVEMDRTGRLLRVEIVKNAVEDSE